MLANHGIDTDQGSCWHIGRIVAVIYLLATRQQMSQLSGFGNTSMGQRREAALGQVAATPLGEGHRQQLSFSRMKSRIQSQF
jgi:hypothetical protein